MRKMMAAALAGTMLLAATPAVAGTFLVEVGAPLGSPNGGGNLDAPKFRVSNTTPGSATTPYLLSLAFALDATTAFTITDFTNFGAGGLNGGTDNSPGVGTPKDTIAVGGKSGLLTYGATNFDPGAYSSFTVNFGPGTTDFRQALFTGTNTLTGTFSDGSVSSVTFAGNPNSTATSFSFNSSVAAVPEPATWAMMFLGFGMVAGAARYRRRSTNAVYA